MKLSARPSPVVHFAIRTAGVSCKVQDRAESDGWKPPFLEAVTGMGRTGTGFDRYDAGEGLYQCPHCFLQQFRLRMDTKQILIVDDEDHVRLSLKQVLEDAGYHVTTAEDGPVALDHLEESPCDLVLLDLRMPELSGRDVLDAIKDRRPDLPVAIVTAHGTVDEAVELIREGAENFIHKPFTPEQIRTTVAQALAEEPSAPKGAYGEHIENARATIRGGEYEQARQHVQEAFAIDATRPEAFNLLGVLMQLENKYQEAQRYYQSALALQPGYEPAVHNRDNVSRSPSVRNPADVRLE